MMQAYDGFLADMHNAEIEDRIRDIVSVSSVLSVANGRYAAVDVVRGDQRATVYIKGLPEAAGSSDQPDPRDEELAALRERIAELEARDTSVFADAPLLPAPDALMSDYGPVGTDEEFAGVFPTWLIAEHREGESVDARIQRLTETFRLRVNELNNLLLGGIIEPEQEEERDRLLKQYDELAKLGDRS